MTTIDKSLIVSEFIALLYGLPVNMPIVVSWEGQQIPISREDLSIAFYHGDKSLKVLDISAENM